MKGVILRILLYSVVLSVSAGIVFLDAKQLQTAENSYTEVAQEAYLFIIVIMGLWSVRKANQFKTFAYLLVSIAGIFFVREFNNLLSNNLYDGAWETGVLIILLPSLFYFYKHAKQLKEDTLALKDTAGFGLLMMGGLLLIVFSRMYGNKNIWKSFMQEAYDRTIKEVSEESIELMAYSVILIACYEIFAKVRRLPQSNENT